MPRERFKLISPPQPLPPPRRGTRRCRLFDSGPRSRYLLWTRAAAVAFNPIGGSFFRAEWPSMLPTPPPCHLLLAASTTPNPWPT